jgi:hypothetical protein
MDPDDDAFNPEILAHRRWMYQVFILGQWPAHHPLTAWLDRRPFNRSVMLTSFSRWALLHIDHEEPTNKT